jgi:hypothetical protein
MIKYEIKFINFARRVIRSRVTNKIVLKKFQALA